MRRKIVALLAVLLALPILVPGRASAQETLQQRVEAKLREAGAGTRFGLVVADEEGRELIAIGPDDRFIPASNTKMLTTAAAFAVLSAVDQPDASGGAAVRLEREGRAPPDVVLVGNGDARLSSAETCIANCLAALADAVATKNRIVRHIVGDASLFPDQRWSPGMSWNNIPSRSGTAIAALSLDDNELSLLVTPTAFGRPPTLEGSDYYHVENRALTTASGTTNIEVERHPGTNVAFVTGTIAVGAKPELVRFGIDDPAHYAAWRFRDLLRARGVRVTGVLSSRYRRAMPFDDPKNRGGVPPARPPRPEVVAKLTPPPLEEDLVLTNKVSQNMHAELLLRRVGLESGTGSIADGVAVIRAMFDSAGVAPAAYDFSDGSGMSTYNRIAPRGMVRFLRWAAAQPWGGAWRATLPVAGVDGTLAKRFRGTSLERKLFAKTGTLNATSALAGYMLAKSGQTLTFSIYANDVPGGGGAIKTMDAALGLIADAN